MKLHNTIRSAAIAATLTAALAGCCHTPNAPAAKPAQETVAATTEGSEPYVRPTTVPPAEQLPERTPGPEPSDPPSLRVMLEYKDSSVCQDEDSECGPTATEEPGIPVTFAPTAPPSATPTQAAAQAPVSPPVAAPEPTVCPTQAPTPPPTPAPTAPPLPAQTPAPATPEPAPTTAPTAAPSAAPVPAFDINEWIARAQEYAVNAGLNLDPTATACWDAPIVAGAQRTGLEMDLRSRMERYARDESILDVWVWAQPRGDGNWDLYIGYA